MHAMQIFLPLCCNPYMDARCNSEKVPKVAHGRLHGLSAISLSKILASTLTSGVTFERMLELLKVHKRSRYTNLRSLGRNCAYLAM